MTEKTSKELWAESRAMYEKAQEVAKPYMDRVRELDRLYKIQLDKECWQKLDNGSYLESLTDYRLKDAFKEVYNGYLREYEGPESSGLHRFSCAYCPFVDLGGGIDWPGCCAGDSEGCPSRFDVCNRIYALVDLARIKNDMVRLLGEDFYNRARYR